MRPLVLAVLMCVPTQLARADVPRFLQPGALPVGLSLLLARPAPPAAAGPPAAASPGAQCRQAVRTAGRQAGIPDHLMSAIAHVESGRRDPQGGINPWPWSINVEGIDHIYDSKAEVIAAVQGFQARGIRSIDVGCMQVNLMYHPTAFATLDQAFDPVANATYAASFLKQLYAQTGSWPAATAAYHSAVPDIGGPYEHKVESVLAEEQRRDDAAGPAPAAGAMRTAMAAPPMMSGGPGAIMLGNRSQTVRLLPMAPGTVGRGLDAYRAAPVMIASRQPIQAVR